MFKSMFKREKEKIQKYIEDAMQKTSRPHLIVEQSGGHLSFKIDYGHDTMSEVSNITIGWSEFVSIINQNQQIGIPKEEFFASITVNGMVLNPVGERQFWKQYEQKF